MAKESIDDIRISASMPTVAGGITVRIFLESSSPLKLHNRNAQKRWLKPNPNSSIKGLKSSARFYDRRAELLAYSRQLRSSTSQQESIANSDFRSKPRAKKWKWYLPLRKLQNAFSRVLRKDRACRYERIETQGMGKRHEWCHPRSMTCNKAKQRRISRLFKKLWRGCCRWKSNKVKLHQ